MSDSAEYEELSDHDLLVEIVKELRSLYSSVEHLNGIAFSIFQSQNELLRIAQRG